MAREIVQDHFYVTCSSNECKEFYPANKSSTFKTRLIESVNLKNDGTKWEVGLSSFMYSSDINNVGKCMLMTLYCYDGHTIHAIDIKDGLVKNVEGFVQLLNDSVSNYRRDVKMELEQYKQTFDVTDVTIIDTEGEYIERPISRSRPKREIESDSIQDLEFLVTGIIDIETQKFLAYMVSIKKLEKDLTGGSLSGDDQMYFMFNAISLLTKIDDIWRYLHYFVNAQKGAEWKDTELMQQIIDSLSFVEYATTYGKDYLKTIVKLVMETYQVILFTWISNPEYDEKLRLKLNTATLSTIAWVNNFKPVIENVEEYLRQANFNLNVFKGSRVSFQISDTLQRLHETPGETREKKEERMNYQRSYMKTMSSWFQFMQSKILSQCKVTADKIVDCKEWYMYRTMFELWTVYMHINNLTNAYKITVDDLEKNILSFEAAEIKKLKGEKDEFVVHETAVKNIEKVNNEYFGQLLNDGVITSGKKELIDMWYRPLDLMKFTEVSVSDEAKLYSGFTDWTKLYLERTGNTSAVEELERKKKEMERESLESSVIWIKEYLGARLMKRFKLTDKKITEQLESGTNITDIIITALKENPKEKPPMPTPAKPIPPTIPKPTQPTPPKPRQPKPTQPTITKPTPPKQTQPTLPKQTQPKPIVPPPLPLPKIISVSVKRPNEEDDDRPVKRMNGVAFTLNSRGDLEFIGNGEKPQDEFVKLLERKEEAIKIQYDEQSDRPLSIADMNRDDKLLDESAKRKYKEALKYNHVASMSRHFTTVTHIDIVLHPFLYDLKIVPIKPINVFERELDKDAIKFEYVKETGKIKIVTASPILDFACSPTLLKALGFDIRDSWIYSIAALERRISYRDLLVEIYLPKISNRRINEWKQLYDTLKENITEPLGDFFTKQQKSKKKPSGRFNEGKVYENIFNISPFKFQREIQKAYTNSHHGQFWTTSFIPKQFYEFVLKELNGMNEVPLLDAIVTIMLKQTPFPFYIPKGEANIHTIGCIFVNTNIIDPEYINNERLRILDIIPCRVHETKAAFIEKYEASTIHYKPVSSVNLSEIEFQLSTALGESVPFRQGPVMVQLHFRKR